MRGFHGPADHVAGPGRTGAVMGSPPAAPTDPGADAWLAAAAGVLRKAGRMTNDEPPERAWELLTTSTIDPVPVPPLGTPSLLTSIPGAPIPRPGLPGEAPFTRGAELPTGGWDIRAFLDDDDPVIAAGSALDDLNGGATSLWLRIGPGAISPGQLPDVLAEVRLDLAPVVLSTTAGGDELESAETLAALIRGSGEKPHPAVNFGLDPVGRAVRTATTDKDLHRNIDRSMATAARLAAEHGVRAAVVDGTAVHDRGAGDAAELGWGIAAGTTYLRALEKAGAPISAALRLVEFRFAAADEQFLTIAKFRAARLLWDRVAELAGAAADRPGQIQHAVTSAAMMTRYDSYTNLLRTTVAAFAAGVAGAQSVTVLPLDIELGMPNPLARRLARNISHLLIGESHVVATADPAGGAYAVEALTWEMAEAGWQEFQLLERAGLVAALTDGSLQHRWSQSAARRAEDLGLGRRAITGVSQYPLAQEILPTRRRRSPDSPDLCWATPFESMRDRPCPGGVFVLTLGPMSGHAARQSFVANTFAAGGIGAASGGPFDSVTAAVAAHQAAGSPPVACLVGSDTAYAEQGPALIPALRATGVIRILLAGKPSGELAGLIDDHLAAGDNVLDFLARTRSVLLDREPATR